MGARAESMGALQAAMLGPGSGRVNCAPAYVYERISPARVISDGALPITWDALNKSILDLSEHGKGKSRFSLSFIFNELHSLKMATLPCVAGISE